MSNPVTTSFGFAVGKHGFGYAYNVQVPSGSLSSAVKIPLFGDQDSSSKTGSGFLIPRIQWALDF